MWCSTWSAGRAKLVIDSTFTLSEAEQAHARLQTGARSGRLVLTN
jgi:NADPH:quinone reductase-like Zn-dependent oxidoreductase